MKHNGMRDKPDDRTRKQAQAGLDHFKSLLKGDWSKRDLKLIK